MLALEPFPEIWIQRNHHYPLSSARTELLCRYGSDAFVNDY